jgi:hypothetical protein
MKDGRRRCRCRVWGDGTGSQCKNPAKTDGICGTHLSVVERGRLPIAGFYDKPRPRIWGEELNGNFHQVPEGAKAGDTIPWKSNATEPRENTARPDESVDDSGTGRATTRDGSKHIVFSRDGVNFHGDMGEGGSIIITGVKKLARFRNEHAGKLLKKGIDVPDGCWVVTSWTNYETKFKEALDRPENIKLKAKFKVYPSKNKGRKCKKMYTFIHMSPGAPGEGALLDLIRESVDW